MQYALMTHDNDILRQMYSRECGGWGNIAQVPFSEEICWRIQGRGPHALIRIPLLYRMVINRRHSTTIKRHPPAFRFIDWLFLSPYLGVAPCVSHSDVGTCQRRLEASRPSSGVISGVDSPKSPSIGLQGEHGVWTRKRAPPAPQRRLRRQKPSALFCWSPRHVCRHLAPILSPASSSRAYCLPFSSDNPDHTPPRPKTRPRADSSTDATGLPRAPETRGFCRPKNNDQLGFPKFCVWASGRDTMARQSLGTE